MSFRDKNIVVIGGGTGNSVLLKELKKRNEHISAVVTVSDDGGSTGRLRKDLGILAVGDIRNCISALAEDESTMAKLMEHRFSKGKLKNHCFGNLFLAALNEISESFPLAIKGLSDVLAIDGEVVAVTKNNITLNAILTNKNVVHGESNIPKEAIRKKTKIKKVYLTPKETKANDYAIEKINNADVILISPGSLYTSIIPNLLIDEVAKAISDNKTANKYLVANMMTQHGETDGYDLEKHIKAIEKHIDNTYKVFDSVIYNTGEFSKDIISNYNKKYAVPVENNISEELREKYNFIGLDLAMEANGVVRHNSKVLFDYISQEIK